MNFNSDYIESPPNRQPTNSFPPTTTSTTAAARAASTATTNRASLPTNSSQVTVVHDPHQTTDRASQPTAATTPPSLHSSPPAALPHAPSPPSIPSEAEIYGPQRLFGNPLSPASNNAALPSRTPSVRFMIPQPTAMAAAGASQDPSLARDFKDDLARAASVVTPGVDDMPYIRHALEVMTKVEEDEGTPRSSKKSSATHPSHPSHPSHPRTPRNGRNPYAVQQPPPTYVTPTRRSVHDAPRTPSEHSLDDTAPRRNSEPGTWSPISLSPMSSLGAVRQLERGWQQRTARPEEHLEPWETPLAPLGLDNDDFRTPPLPVKEKAPRDVEEWRAQPDDASDPELARKTPPLDYKPWILRRQSFALLIILSLLMVTALVFSAVYSLGRNGLMPYGGSIYGGDYFVFRILPQLLAAILLIYTQTLISTAMRILPFSSMASDDLRQRRNAAFLPLYKLSFLWPQFVGGDWHVWVPVLNAWVLNFTLPLQSCLFTPILVDGTWTWATVQGIAWTLVALYLLLILSTIFMLVFWLRRRTGMPKPWDLRTLADVIFLVAQSNSVQQYHGSEKLSTKAQLKRWIPDNVDRLGYWLSPEISTNRRWYGIGMPSSEEELDYERIGEKAWSRIRSEGGGYEQREHEAPSMANKSRYLPFCLRTAPLVSFTVISTILLIALIAVSFDSATKIRNGFLPGLSAEPRQGDFSAANFLFSFIPSLLGLVLYLGFQSFDLTLRIMTPWGELRRREGATAETSLLLDYAACSPWEAMYKAARHRHWRVVFMSSLSGAFVLLPVLGGGMFMALTPPSGIVRMYPNIAVFGVVLTLLILYVLGLACLIPRREQFMLPHGVTCLAEIISFCANDELRADTAFATTFTRQQLMDRLDCEKEPRDQSRWVFNCGPRGDERMGIKRCQDKFTSRPRNMRRFETGARGELIAKANSHSPRSSP